MRYHRADVVDRALAVLDAYGLADLTMRRLGGELGVQPSALYHHFPDKQSLLAAVADEILARGRRQVTSGWPRDFRPRTPFTDRGRSAPPTMQWTPTSLMTRSLVYTARTSRS